MRHRTFLKGMALTAAAATLRVKAKESKGSNRPNVLLIMTDQQIADGYSAKLGKEFMNTPAMDKLAARSRVYDRAYSPNPICMPARTAMWSGHYSHTTGIQTNKKAVIDAAEFPTLGTVFSRAGYSTGYVGKWHAAYPVDKKAEHGFEWTANMENDGNGLDAATPAGAAEFISGKHEKPWLLVVSFNNPHNICEWARGHVLPDGDVGTPPPLAECPPQVTNHSPAENELEIMAEMRRSYHATRMCTPVGTFGEKEWREYRWAYYRMIEMVDRQVGDVLASLEKSGQADDTLVVFTSDHGDMMGAHRWNQKSVFYEESSRVPFFLSLPKKIKPGSSKELVNMGIDLMPTLCNFAGIPAPSSLPGLSLKLDKGGRKYIVIQNHLVQGEELDGRKPEPQGRMVRSDRFKYCVYDLGDAREELFDMEKDPGESVNQAKNPEYKTELKRHRKYLKEWAQKHDDAFPVL